MMIAELNALNIIIRRYMKKQSLVNLIQDLEQEMLRLGYTKGSMTFYRRQWKALLLFAQKKTNLLFRTTWA
jgi:integrase/recombinase XerD